MFAVFTEELYWTGDGESSEANRAGVKAGANEELKLTELALLDNKS